MLTVKKTLVRETIVRVVLSIIILWKFEVHCPSNPDKYSCSEQGVKTCLLNRTGADCELCVANHYGEDCSTFCKESLNYTCSGSGGTNCKEHFYNLPRTEM